MPIQILPPELANQIAAGEVVERPASIVKELIENSLDAGATTIQLDIEKGGTKLIRVRDNGLGINKDELALALTRHATSKIHSLDDLTTLQSFGFRGEALASICSVSRLTLISHPSQQSEAWQAYTEGREMQVLLKPAAHPIGTTIEVLDLFYNTPARRKFLRSDKTEFIHIEEVVRRIALSHPDVALRLLHNDKTVKHYRAQTTDENNEKRLSDIFGTSFAKKARWLNWQHDELTLDGWLFTETLSSESIQYFYINGRIIKDRLLNHAVRQAYQRAFGENTTVNYILYLTLPSHQVDVNVHPAKHEVRFQQSRLIHDFIYQAVLSLLQQDLSQPIEQTTKNLSPSIPKNRITAGENTLTNAQATLKNRQDSLNYHHNAFPSTNTVTVKEAESYYHLITPATSPLPNDPVSTIFSDHNKLKMQMDTLFLNASAHTFGRVLAIYQQRFAIIEYPLKLALLSLSAASEQLYQRHLQQEQHQEIDTLLIPLAIPITKQEKMVLSHHVIQLLAQLNIQLTLSSNKLMLNGVPLRLRQLNWHSFLPQLIIYLTNEVQPDKTRLIHYITKQLSQQKTNWSQAQAVQLIAELEQHCPDVISSPPASLIQFIDLNPTIMALTSRAR